MEIVNGIALLRVEEAAERLAVGRETVSRLVNDGTLPSVRIGRSVRIPADELAAWVEANTTRATPRRKRHPWLPDDDEEEEP